MKKRILFVSNTDWTLYHHWFQNLIGLRDAGYDLTLCSPKGPLVEHLRAAGFKHVTYELDRKGMNLFGEAATILQIAKVLSGESPDLIHALTVKPAIYTAFLLRFLRITHPKYRSILIVNTYTGLGSLFEENEKLVRFILRPFLKFALKRPLVLQSFLNPGNLQTFQKLDLIHGDNSFITPSEGVDTQAFQPAANKRSGKPFVVLLAARVLWSKGIGEFVEAARILKNDRAHYEFLVVGEPDFGNPQAIPLETLKAWEMEGYVKFLGHMENMPAIMQNADVLVLPSYHEGAPKVIKEAMSTGLPVIASDIPGCRILVEDGKDGFLVPVKNASMLAMRIKELKEDADLYSRFSKSARLKAENVLDHKHVVAYWIKKYQDFFANKSL